VTAAHCPRGRQSALRSAQACADLDANCRTREGAPADCRARRGSGQDEAAFDEPVPLDEELEELEVLDEDDPESLDEDDDEEEDDEDSEEEDSDFPAFTVLLVDVLRESVR
jgi:hypothetical protein